MNRLSDELVKMKTFAEGRIPPYIMLVHVFSESGGTRVVRKHSYVGHYDTFSRVFHGPYCIIVTMNEFRCNRVCKVMMCFR